MRPMRSWPKRAWVGMPSTLDITREPLAPSGGEDRVRGPLPRTPAPSHPHPTLSLPSGGRGDGAVMLLLHQRALALIERPECLIGGNGRAGLLVVPQRLRFRGLLFLPRAGRAGLAPPPPPHTHPHTRMARGPALLLCDERWSLVA